MCSPNANASPPPLPQGPFSQQKNKKDPFAQQKTKRIKDNIFEGVSKHYYYYYYTTAANELQRSLLVSQRTKGPTSNSDSSSHYLVSIGIKLSFSKADIL